MRLEQKIMIIKEKARDYVRVGAALTMLYVAIAVPASIANFVIHTGMRLGLEVVAKPSKTTIRAKLEKKSYEMLLNSKGILYYGVFIRKDGRKIKLYDSPSILDKKLFVNTIIPKLKENKDYYITMRTSNMLKDYCISAKEIKIR